MWDCAHEKGVCNDYSRVKRAGINEGNSHFAIRGLTMVSKGKEGFSSENGALRTVRFLLLQLVSEKKSVSL